MPDITSPRPVSGQPVATAWGDEVHDQLEGLQAGTAVLTWTASAISAAVNVTFPRAYTVAPIVLVAAGPGAGGPNNNVGVTAVTTTGFTAQSREVRDQSSTSTLSFAWVAIGTPA